ncbi:MAG: hypothetical protein JWQ09_62 [Segetibacter sp.]|nr:hypothetical protein [Segetibacter sp.]
MKIFGIILFFFILQKAIAQSVITIQHGSTVKVETRFDSAVAHAESGDYIYLPGGLIASAGSIAINKKMSIFGAGYRSDSSSATSPTLIQAQITFGEGSEGSFITGIYTTGNMDIYVSSVIVTRCNIVRIGMNTNISNLLLEENVFRGGMYGYGGPHTLSSITIRKNILYGSLDSDIWPGVTYTNNIFVDATSSPSSNLFQNNIFIASGTFSSSSSFINNLFVGNLSTNDNSTGNILNETLANIFINFSSGQPWNLSQNFHLKPGCKGIALGTDGKDAGIYGSGTPFKEGAIPFNPHYQKVVIPSATNSNGKLEINITVQAQDH